MTPKEIEALMAEADGLVLMQGEWIEVDREKLQEALDHWQRVEAHVGDGLSFIDGMRMLAGAATGTQDVVGLEEVAEWSRVEAGE